MKNFVLFLAIVGLLGFTQCQPKNKKMNTKKNFITEQTVEKTQKALVDKYGKTLTERINRGVQQAASLWTQKEGKQEDFEKFCTENFIGDTAKLVETFNSLSANFESIYGNFNKMSLDLKRKLHIDQGEIMPIDDLFGGYEPSAHINDDFFENKIAFVTLLNFPFYSLKDKTEKGSTWTREQWAYARLGDMFTSRIPAQLIQKSSEVTTGADTYISNYNIYMGNLLDNQNKSLFPKGMKLITHWGLRDELKANYNATNGLEKQKMIYEVMKRIISQEIPQDVINDSNFTWNPYSNKLLKTGKDIVFKPEPDTRYQHLLNIFKALHDIDAYSPMYPTNIQRKFEQEMEIPVDDVEKLFISLLTSKEVKQVGQLISTRLGRKLQPFDIWYDGFKARNTVSQEELDAKVKAKYPSKDAFESDLPNLLLKLGFTKEKATWITSKITVDASRGAGHAWGAQMKTDKAHLRTRIGKDGMNYKGYNIAVHEFGHNVEQTISLNDVDYYLMNGVPNTAFTEALAFIYQKRDLELLGIKDNNPNKEFMLTLDNFWACYEIMGVSLVDIKVWKWLYENPKATAIQLKEEVIRTAKEIWNAYYADVFGVKDQPILGIYSHMIDSPLYLSAYPIGHLIDFQIEKQIAGKNFADEIQRIYKNGRLIPQVWMKQAVGSEISVQPMLQATDEALKVIVK